MNSPSQQMRCLLCEILFTLRDKIWENKGGMLIILLFYAWRTSSQYKTVYATNTITPLLSPSCSVISFYSICSRTVRIMYVGTPSALNFYSDSTLMIAIRVLKMKESRWILCWERQTDSMEKINENVRGTDDVLCLRSYALSRASSFTLF